MYIPTCLYSECYLQILDVCEVRILQKMMTFFKNYKRYKRYVFTYKLRPFNVLLSIIIVFTVNFWFILKVLESQGLTCNYNLCLIFCRAYVTLSFL